MMDAKTVSDLRALVAEPVMVVHVRNGDNNFALRHQPWPDGTHLLYSERQIHAPLDRIDALEAAARAVMPYVATRAVGCHGDKCRESWCYSCCGEDEAAEAAEKGRDAYHTLHHAITKAPTHD
jgi:hypothetical protein